MDERDLFKPAPLLVAGFTFLILILSIATPALADVGISISGVVHDTSGVPLSQVNVRLAETPVGTTTDPSGRFIFRNLSAGNYTLQASHIGFYSAFASDIAVREGMPARVELSLTPHPLALPEVTVHSSGVSRGVADNEVIVLSQYWSAAGAKSVGDALREIQGVEVREGAGGTKISLRGSPPRAVRINWNGVPLNDAGTGEADLNGISLDDLSHIRVKFSGFGGEIDLATRSSIAESHPFNMALNGRTGSNDLAGGGGRIDASAGDWAGSVSGGQEFSAGDFSYELDDGSKLTRVNNQSHSENVSGEMSRSIGRSTIRANGFYSDVRRGAPGLIYSAPTPQAELRNRRLIASLFADGSGGSFHWSGQGFFSHNISYYDSPSRQYNPATGKIVNHIAESSRHIGWRVGANAALTINGATSFSLPISNATTLSSNFQSDHFRGEDLLRGTTLVGGIGLGDARRDVSALAVQSTFRAEREGLSAQLTPSASLENIFNSGQTDYRFFASNVSGSVTCKHERTDVTFFSSWGRNLNAPPFNAQFLVENIYAVGNPDLKPEQGEMWRGGVESIIRFARAATVRISTAYFNSRIEDLIIWQRNSAGKYYPDNLTCVKSNGVEGGLTLDLEDWLSWSLNYMVEDARLDIPGDVNDGNQPPMTVRESGNSRLLLNLQPVTASIASRWAGKRYSTASNMDDISTAGMGLGAYTVWDAHVGVAYNIARISCDVGVGVDNIFDRSYRIVERSPMAGRVYSVSLSVRV